MKLKLEFILICFLIIVSSNELRCEDSSAMKECLQKYKESSIISAQYLNYGCKLLCTQSKHIFQHSLLQGINCPELKNTSDKNKICLNGLCVDPKSQNSYYSLDVQIIRGYFPDSLSEHYVKVCVQRNNETINRPLKDTNGCECQTSRAISSLEPKWDYNCPKTIVLMANEKEFLDKGIVVFEVYNNFSENNQFYGNGFISMKELIGNEMNGKENMIYLYQDLNGKSKEIGRVFVIINWSFKFNRKFL